MQRLSQGNVNGADKSALFFSHARLDHPFDGASGAINTYMSTCLERLGYTVRAFHPTPELLPFHALDILRETQPRRSVDLTVYCDRMLSLHGANLPRSDKTMVFFHGLISHALVWMTRDDIDVLCGNSRWLRDCLIALAGFPVWSEYRVHHPSIFRLAQYVRCPVPALEYPEGAIKGSELTPAFLARLEQSDDVLGFDFQPEANNGLHFGILAMLNILAAQHGEKQRYRLVVPQSKQIKLKSLANRLPFTPMGIQLQELLTQAGLSLEDLYLTTPGRSVRQSDLFRIMRASQFALAFNDHPESFGLMPLESILCDTPVYTNGSGNLRHLLPEHCGIVVEDNEALATYTVSEFRRIATRIRHDLSAAQQDEDDHVIKHCQRGSDYIRRHYSRKAFSEDLGALLRQDFRAQPPPQLEELMLSLSPLVRHWDDETRFVISDYRHCRLDPEQNALLKDALGQSAAATWANTDRAKRMAIDAMWRQGILTWAIERPDG